MGSGFLVVVVVGAMVVAFVVAFVVGFLVALVVVFVVVVALVVVGIWLVGSSAFSVVLVVSSCVAPLKLPDFDPVSAVSEESFVTAMQRITVHALKMMRNHLHHDLRSTVERMTTATMRMKIVIAASPMVTILVAPAAPAAPAPPPPPPPPPAAVGAAFGGERLST